MRAWKNMQNGQGLRYQDSSWSHMILPPLQIFEDFGYKGCCTFTSRKSAHHVTLYTTPAGSCFCIYIYQVPTDTQ